MLHDLSFFVLAFVSLFSVFTILIRALKGYISAYTFVIPILAFFYVLPIYMDFLIGVEFKGPIYSFTIYDALTDKKTETIYNYYMAFVLLLFTIFSRKYKKTISYEYNDRVNSFFDSFYKWRWMCYFLLILPFLVALLSNDLGFYLEYANRPRLESNFFQILASKLTSIFMPIFALLVVSQVRKCKLSNNKILCFIVLISIIFFIFVDIYIHGKRSIVISFIVLLLLVFLITNTISKKSVFYFGLIVIPVFYFYLQFYGKNIEEARGIFATYHGLRIDLSRDYSLKFVIFHEILNENYILPYKGASYNFLLTFFIPREIWPDKPFPYAVYFTNAAFGDFGGSYLYGWGLTTSFIMEAISNLGFFGFAFFPLFYAILIKKVEGIRNLILKILAYLILILLLVLHPMSSVILIIIFFILLFFNKYKLRFRLERKFLN